MNQPQRLRGNTTFCPHCGTRCFTVKTNQVSPVVREITFQCPNNACGHQFVAQLAPVRTITPSRLTNPKAAPRMPAAANDDRP